MEWRHEGRAENRMGGGEAGRHGGELSGGVVGVDRPGAGAKMMLREKNADNHLT